MPRSRDAVTLFREAGEAEMAGILLKDHCFPTHGTAFALNAWARTSARAFPTRAFGAIALNVTVGGVNPLAAEGALKAGVDLVYFPTYSTGPHLQKLGREHLPMPLPRGEFAGIGILDTNGEVIPEVDQILDLVRDYDAVLATGHLSPKETLLLIQRAAAKGLPRVIVTHASEVVPGLSVTDQRHAVELGAMIEHCFLATTDAVPGSIPVAEIVRQTKEVGAENVILSSDYGKESLGSPVEGFRRALNEAAAEGLSRSELDLVVRANPHRLLVEGRLQP
jgi:hypothetical protein